MSQDDKEFLIDVLDDITVFLVSLNDKAPVPARLYERLARASGLLERNYFKLDEPRYHDWHDEEGEDTGSDGLE